MFLRRTMSSYDPRFRRRLALQEGAYRLALGLNPYGAGAAHAPPLLLFLYAKAVPATPAAVAAASAVGSLLGGSFPVGWAVPAAEVLLPRAVAFAADMAGAALVYSIAEV
jgi:hypothetical protein